MKLQVYLVYAILQPKDEKKETTTWVKKPEWVLAKDEEAAKTKLLSGLVLKGKDDDYLARLEVRARSF